MLDNEENFVLLDRLRIGSVEAAEHEALGRAILGLLRQPPSPLEHLALLRAVLCDQEHYRDAECPLILRLTVRHRHAASQIHSFGNHAFLLLWFAPNSSGPRFFSANRCKLALNIERRSHRCDLAVKRCFRGDCVQYQLATDTLPAARSAPVDSTSPATYRSNTPAPK